MPEIGSLFGLAPRAAKPQMTPPADLGAAALDQLEFLVEHAAGGLHLDGCRECWRYVAARRILLSIFEEPK